MLKFADLVRQFSTTTGTGPIVLSSTPVGFHTFASALATGDTFYYSIINIDKPAETETGIGTMLAGGTSFSRAPVGAATSFSAGKKQVSLTAGAAFFAAVQALLTAGVIDPASLAAALAAKADAAATTAALASKADAAATTAALATKADATATAAALAAKVDAVGLNELIDDRVAALLAPGSGITLTYDDAGNLLTISSTGGGGGGGGIADGTLDFSAASQSGLTELAF